MKKKMNEMRKFETEKKRKKYIYRKKEKKKYCVLNSIILFWVSGCLE
jgi:hypothetical protein